MGEAESEAHVPLERWRSSIVKSQYGKLAAGSTDCTACSNASVSAMCCVMKPSPSCMWSHARSDASCTWYEVSSRTEM